MKATGAPRGVDSIKTMRGRGIRSIPRHGDDSYLDLYMLHKEKARLEKEMCHSGKRSEVSNKRLQSIRERIEKLESLSPQRDTGKRIEIAGRKTPKKDWKVMSIDY